MSVLVIFAHPDEGESKADFVFTFYPAEGGQRVVRRGLRMQVGLQVTPISSVTIDARFRVLKPASGKTDSDVFVQMHLYRYRELSDTLPGDG